MPSKTKSLYWGAMKKRMKQRANIQSLSSRQAKWKAKTVYGWLDGNDSELEMVGVGQMSKKRRKKKTKLKRKMHSINGKESKLRERNREKWWTDQTFKGLYKTL